MKKRFNPVLPEAQAEIDALVVSQNPIRTDLLPEASGDWSQAKRGVFYHLPKKQITLHLDADLVDWFEKNLTQAEEYQTGINQALREYVSQQQAVLTNQ